MSDINRGGCRACLVDCLAGVFTTVRSQDFFSNKSAVVSNLLNAGPCHLRNIIFGPLYFLVASLAKQVSASRSPSFSEGCAFEDIVTVGGFSKDN